MVIGRHLHLGGELLHRMRFDGKVYFWVLFQILYQRRYATKVQIDIDTLGGKKDVNASSVIFYGLILIHVVITIKFWPSSDFDEVR